jgi:PA14 domain
MRSILLRRWRLVAAFAAAASLLAVTSPVSSVSSVSSVSPSGTKLIALDGVFKPFQYRQALANVDSLPFDGVAISLQTSFQPFFATGINTSGQAQDRLDLDEIGAARLQDSFALIWATPPQDSWNWFDDAAWAQTETNLREVAKMVKQYKLKGVMFDPEPYENRLLWGYNKQTLPAAKPSFAEYQAKVFVRGARFMQVLEQEAPGLIVMTTRLFTDSVDTQGQPFSNAQLQDSDYYGLVPAFGAGMIHGATDSSIIIDGNERSYDYAVANDFQKANAEIASLRSFADPADRARYDRVLQPSHSVYPDGVRAINDSRFLGFYLRSQPLGAASLSTALNVIADNTRNALEKSKSYAWVYLESERLATVSPSSEVVQAIARGKAAAGTQQTPFTDQTVATNGRTAYINKSSLSGTMTAQNGGPLELVSVQTSDNRMGCVHSVAGQYFVCQGFSGWSGTLTPVLAGYRFDPPSRPVTNLVGNLPGFGFVAIPDSTVTTLSPTTVTPTTVAPTTLKPTTVTPTTVAPTTLKPTTLAPTTVKPTTIAPTTIAPTTIAPTTIAPTTIALTTPGSITRERWNRIQGYSVANIPLNRAPDVVGTLTSFDAPVNDGDNYGQRIRGYLTAPKTGTYRFWIAGDDSAQLFLSTDSSTANKNQIAYLNSWTPWRVFNRYSTQRSAAISLVAGQRYYIEALMKEARGGDNLTVAWSPPGYSENAPAEMAVPGWVLSPIR